MTFADSSYVPTDVRSALRANCADCFALCCTAFGFQRSADFPIDKPAGTPCSNLTDDFSCSIHDSLRPRGFRGCTVFDCFGAGQYVSQTLFGGTSWSERPDTSADMFSTFAVVRQLHEMLWYLVEAAERTTDVRAFRAGQPSFEATFCGRSTAMRHRYWRLMSRVFAQRCGSR